MNGFDFVSKRLPDCNLSPWIDVFDLRKGQVLLAQGQTMGALFYVVSGLLREYKYLVVILELYEESDLFSISYHQHKDNKVKSAMYAPPNTIYFFPMKGSSHHAFEVELLVE